MMNNLKNNEINDNKNKNNELKNNSLNIKYNSMIFFTILIDICLIIILYYDKLNDFDTYNIYTLFVIHIFWYVFLIKKYNTGIDVIHLLFLINIVIISLFVNNYKLILIYISIILLMFSYWYSDGKCPMGRFKSLTYINNLTHNNTYKTLSPYVPVITCILLIYKLKTL